MRDGTGEQGRWLMAVIAEVRPAGRGLWGPQEGKLPFLLVARNLLPGFFDMNHLIS